MNLSQNPEVSPQKGDPYADHPGDAGRCLTPVNTSTQAIAEVRRRPAPIVSAASAIDRYVTDLRATLRTNPDKARRRLARGVRPIVLRRDGPRLCADLEGNLVGVLDLDDSTIAPRGFGNHGAGRGILFERQAQTRIA